MQTAAGHSGSVPDHDSGALQELRGTRAKYQALVEQIPAILYVDLPEQDHETVYISPQIQEILGISVEEYIQGGEEIWLRLLHPEDRGRVLEQHEVYLAGGPDIAEYRMVRPDGRVVWIRDRASLLRDEQGRLIEQGVMFDVTEQKEAEAIIGRQVDLLKKVDTIGREFTDLVLRGAGLRQILGGLARIVGNPVVLEDQAHQPIDFAAHGVAVEDLLGRWENHSRRGHEEDIAGVVHVEESEPRCGWIPVWLRDEAWGRVHVLAIDGRLDEIDLMALDRAAAAVGLALLSEREADNLADHAGSALVFDVLQGRSIPPKEVIRRAVGLGADLEGRQLAAVAVELPWIGRLAAEESLPERDRQRIRGTALAATRAAIAEVGFSGLAALQGDRVLGVVGLPRGAKPDLSLDALGERICSFVSSRLEDKAVVVGLSDESDVEGLRRALEDAAEAASHGARSGSSCRVHRSRDRGIQHLLTRLSDGPDLARFVESQLHPLLQHDAKSVSPLIPTLRVVLANAGSKSAAARELHIQRRTLYHRLVRIEELLKRRLDDHETWVQLDIALRGLDLLRARANIGEGLPAGRE